MASATPPSDSTDLATTSIRIERERLDAFKQVATAHRRSVSQELRWVIDKHIESHQEEAEAA
jgi:predicted DNA-binding protein